MACIFKAADETSAVAYFLYNLLLEEPDLGSGITTLAPTDYPAIATLIDERIESYHPDHAAFYLYECELKYNALKNQHTTPKLFTFTSHAAACVASR